MDQFQPENVSRGCLLNNHSSNSWGNFLLVNLETSLKLNHKQMSEMKLRKSKGTYHRPITTNILSALAGFMQYSIQFLRFGKCESFFFFLKQFQLYRIRLR